MSSKITINKEVLHLIENEILEQIKCCDDINKRRAIRRNVVDFYCNQIRQLYQCTPRRKRWPSYKRTFTNPGEPVRIYVDGCFDLLHAGHFNVLRQAKNAFDATEGENGCVVVAGVHSSKVIQEQKGPTIMSDEERLAVIRSCKYVDEVAFDTPYSPSLAVLNQLQCDYCVHGDDLPIDLKTGKHAYSEVHDAGRLRIVKRTECVSTTEIIGRLISLSKEHKEFRVKRSFLATSDRVANFGNRISPNAEDKVVYVQGSFDIFNIDHVKMLSKAKEFGTFLLVGVLADEVVSKISGNPILPIMPLNERALAVLSSKYTDDCILGAPGKISDEIIAAFNIKTILNFKSKASKINECEYQGTLGAVNVVQLDGFCNIDTSVIIRRVLNNRNQLIERNKKRVQIEKDYVAKKSFISGT